MTTVSARIRTMADRYAEIMGHNPYTGYSNGSYLFFDENQGSAADALDHMAELLDEAESFAAIKNGTRITFKLNATNRRVHWHKGTTRVALCDAYGLEIGSSKTLPTYWEVFHTIRNSFHEYVTGWTV